MSRRMRQHLKAARGNGLRVGNLFPVHGAKTTDKMDRISARLAKGK